MAGRKHVPTRLKILRGTFRKDRQNLSEPTPAAGAPAPRPGMGRQVRVWYLRLAAIVDPPRIATAADGIALELCASAIAEYHAARAVLARQGATYTTKTPTGSTMVRARPEVAIAADAWRRAAAMLRDFGLSPASRPRVNAVPAPREGNPFGRLDRVDRYFSRHDVGGSHA